MKRNENNFAYVDGANLYKGVASLGWKLDYKRFRVWLSEKYSIRATRDTYENRFNNVLIVASDGDYSGLVKFLLEREKLLAILSPSDEEKCSILLKRTGAKISYINDKRSHLELIQKEKAPDGDRTP